MDLKDRIEGVAIGLLMGFENKQPMVVFPSNVKDHAIPARSLAVLSHEDISKEVALLFEDGDVTRPLVVGRIVEPALNEDSPSVVRDGELVKVTATEQLELRCGKASIIMKKTGHITVRGTYVTSHASASNRIRGGSVNLN